MSLSNLLDDLQPATVKLNARVHAVSCDPSAANVDALLSAQTEFLELTSALRLLARHVAPSSASPPPSSTSASTADGARTTSTSPASQEGASAASYPSGQVRWAEMEAFVARTHGVDLIEALRAVEKPSQRMAKVRELLADGPHADIDITPRHIVSKLKNNRRKRRRDVSRDGEEE
jgi:hypothetical protein